MKRGHIQAPAVKRGHIQAPVVKRDISHFPQLHQRPRLQIDNPNGNPPQPLPAASTRGDRLRSPPGRLCSPPSRLVMVLITTVVPSVDNIPRQSS